jgi:hypothetical protein
VSTNVLEHPTGIIHPNEKPKIDIRPLSANDVNSLSMIGLFQVLSFEELPLCTNANNMHFMLG